MALTLRGTMVDWHLHQRAGSGTRPDRHPGHYPGWVYV